MTVLQRETAGVDGRQLAKFVATTILMGAIGVGVVLGLDRIVATDTLSPAQIEQARGSALAEHLENQWIAQVNVTKNADLIEFYRAPFMARVAKIQEQRAADMVEHFSKQYQGTVPMRQGGGGIIFTF
ncbi:MAG TPA: hypothetical protein VGA97_04900 [Acidimicrobiia bacterium]